MDSVANFHRSFVDVTHKSRLQDGWDGYQRVPMQGSFRGYQWAASMPVPTDLISKPNQDFGSYATGWEQRCSTLLNKTGVLLSPVIGGQETPSGQPVIAHYGTVNGNYILVPREHSLPRGGDVRWLRTLIAKDVPAYVLSQAYYPNAGGWAQLEPGQDSIYYFPVLTDVEGRVLAQHGVSLKDDTIEKVDYLAYLAIGSFVVSLGRGLIQRTISALSRRSAVSAPVTALDVARKRWGTAEVLDGGGKAVSTELQIAKDTMQRAMPKIVNPATNKIGSNTFQEFHTNMKNNGFNMTKVESFGPDGGYQIFYQNRNVVARFKTMGDKGGPRAGQTHVSFSLTDGKGMQWTNDLAKFKANGNLAPKAIVKPENFKPGQDFQGNPHRFPVIDSRFDIKVVDSWANSTHFDAPVGFDLRGVGDVVRGQVH